MIIILSKIYNSSYIRGQGYSNMNDNIHKEKLDIILNLQIKIKL